VRSESLHYSKTLFSQKEPIEKCKKFIFFRGQFASFVDEQN